MIIRPKKMLAISLATITVSVLATAVLRPVPGIDFTGGSLMEIETAREVSPEEASRLLREKMDLEASAQSAGDSRLLIRTEPLSQKQHQEAVQSLNDQGVFKEELRYESIGPTIGAELRQKAIVAVTVVLAVLVVYLAYTFRHTAGLISAWKFGVAAIYALVHDLLAVLALFAVLGAWLGVTVDTLFVTAMLAILGYSVNDTIVIFNRLRSQWLTTRRGTLLDALDEAVKKSLTRSLNTSFTTLLVLGALLLLGGPSIRWFIVALAAGTILGTYSSLFVAPPCLYYLAKKG